MDLNHLLSVVAANPYLTWALGVASANRLLILHYLGLAITKIPFLRRIFLGHAEEVLATLDAFRAELLADIEEEKALKATKAQ